MYSYKDVIFRTTTFFYFLWVIVKDSTDFLAKREVLNFNENAIFFLLYVLFA